MTALMRFMVQSYGEPIGVGRYRTVFRDGDWVYKVPHDKEGWGMASNDLEARPWSTRDRRYYARCELVEIQGCIVLKMEYVEHVGRSERADWTWYIDCSQVGRTKDGRLVAYDWGY